MRTSLALLFMRRFLFYTRLTDENVADVLQSVKTASSVFFVRESSSVEIP